DHAFGRRFADLTRERDLASRSVLRVAVTPPSAELASRAHRAVLTRTPPVLHVLRVREGLVHERAWRVEGARDHDVALALRRDRHVVGHRVTELVERLGPAKARLLAPLGREARQSADGHARAPTFGAERHERDDVVVPGIAEPTVGRRRDAPAVHIGEVDREENLRRTLNRSLDACDVVHPAVGSALGDEDLPARTRLELGEGDAYA